VGVLFNNLSKGQRSILNGLREINYLALSQIISAIIGSSVCVIFIFGIGINSIAYCLLIINLSSFFFSALYLRKLKIDRIRVSLSTFYSKSKELIYVGLGFSISAGIVALTTYFSR